MVACDDFPGGSFQPGSSNACAVYRLQYSVVDGFCPVRPHLEACSSPGGPSWLGSVQSVRLELPRVSQPMCAACTQARGVRRETIAQHAQKHAAAEHRSAG